MLSKIVFSWMLVLGVGVAVDFCNPENIKNNPAVAATCQMYDEVKNRTVGYTNAASHVDYETVEAHKMSLIRSQYPASSSQRTLGAHFGLYKKLLDVDIDKKGFIKIFPKPFQKQKADFYCDSRFDLFAEIQRVNGEGQKEATIVFLEKDKDVVLQLNKLVEGMNVSKTTGSSAIKVSRTVPLYCGSLKTNREVTYAWDSPGCSEVRAYSSNPNSADQRVGNELRSGNIVVENVYIGADASSQKACTINYKRETTYDAQCQLVPEDVILNPGESQEVRLMELKRKYTAEKCCRGYPNAFLYIQNPFEIISKNSNDSSALKEIVHSSFGALNLASTIKCVVNTESAGYRTALLMEKLVEPSIEKPFEVGCGGITYTGVYEQNLIDRLNNYKAVLNEVASPYTKCCDGAALSGIQKYGYGYALMQCLPEFQDMIANGTYKGVKVSDSLKDAYSSCSRHLADTDIKGGVMGNSSLVNGGVRITQGFSGTTNFLGCMGEEIADMETIRLIKGCVDSNYADFMAFIDWLVAQQLTLNIGIERFKTEACQEELDRSATIDLVLDLNDFTGSNEAAAKDQSPVSSASGGSTGSRTKAETPTKTSEGDGLRIEEGKNYYGVMKVGNQYIPALTLQDEYAFNATNLARPFGGLDGREEPTMLYAELYDLFGLKFEGVYMANFTDGSLGCRSGVFRNVQKTIRTKLGAMKAVKTIEGYVHLFANNSRILETGEVQDFGLFANTSCSLSQKEDALAFFNIALKRYIRTYLSNKPKTLKEAELGLAQMETDPKSVPTFKYGNTVPVEDENGGVVNDEPVLSKFKSMEEYIVAVKAFIQTLEGEVKEIDTQIQGYYDAKRNECPSSPKADRGVSCVQFYEAAIQQNTSDKNNLRIRIVKLGELVAKHESALVKNEGGAGTGVNKGNGDSLQTANQNPTPPTPGTEYTEEEKIVGDLVSDAYFWANQNPKTPYVWSGTDPSGWDCSGFVQTMYKKKGINIPRNSYAQATWSKGWRIDDQNYLKPGDLVFFKTTKERSDPVTHVGVMVGYGKDGLFAHAKGKDYGTLTEKLSWYLRKNPKKWRWGRRILNTGDLPPMGRTLQAYGEDTFVGGRYVNESYNKEKYEAILRKYEKEELDKDNPIYLKKKSLEIYQNMKRNKEINYYKNINSLKRSIGAF